MKCATFAVVILTLLATLAGCGGGSDAPADENPTSGLTTRAVVANTFSGVNGLRIIDYSTDQATLSTVASEAGIAITPERTLFSRNRERGMVFDPNGFRIFIVDPKQESLVAFFTLGAFVESMAVDPFGNVGYAAVRNSPVSGATPGEVFVMDLRTFDAGNPFKKRIPVPLVETVATSPNATKLLAMSASTNVVTIIDAATYATTALPTVFDRPVAAAFSPDLATAYVLSCGAECGGSEASVIEVNITTGAIGRKTVLQGATAGVWENNRLYVAGNAGVVNRNCDGSPCPGVLSVVDTTNMTVVNTAAISPGTHREISLAQNNKVLVGATQCTVGCLSIYDKATNAVVLSTPDAGELARGTVTGIAPIPGRSVVYVAEGGELRIYDTATGRALPQDQQLNFAGNIVDVEVIDNPL